MKSLLKLDGFSAHPFLCITLSIAALVSTGAEMAVLAIDDPTTESAWLGEVDLLITEEERRAFTSLTRAYQRAAFIERFWEVRDPFPETGQNEFHDAWVQRLELARQRFRSLDHDRARTMLLLGPPEEIRSAPCPELLKPLEAWYYRRRENPADGFFLVFVAHVGRAENAYVHWAPSEGGESLLEWTTARHSEPPAPSGLELSRRCSRAGELAELLDRAIDWRRIEEDRHLVPKPSDEWVAAFLDRSTDLAPGAEPLAASLLLEYPGRHQSRTVVQGLIAVSRAEATPSERDEATFDFLLDGEILRQDELFDQFRYRFQFPESEVLSHRIPLAIQRFLRPGEYTMILKLEDLNAGRFFRSERQIHVPAMIKGAAPGSTGASSAEQTEVDSLSKRLYEANALLSAGDHLVEILPPPDGLRTGQLRVEARAAGDGIAKVTFVLNGRVVMSKTRPPYSVEIDLGRAPRLHSLEAIACDTNGGELARDSIPINAGPHHFSVRLLDPQPGSRHRQSLRAQAEVDVPAGEHLDRVEFFLNETRLATLYQPPFVQPIFLSERRRITYVRVVAHLEDGSATEDLVFVNVPDHMEQLRINLVELYTTVSDRRGTLVEGLSRDAFTILEEGTPQEITRFERVKDLSIHAGIVLDSSTSMAEELDEAVKAAYRFFQAVLRSKDRAAVVVFNDAPVLKVPFTNNLEVLAGGLVELAAEGETALYDTLVFTLHYFAGIRGKRAVILLSDGRDSNSRHSFSDALGFAQRTGVAVYTIGLGISPREMEVRALLQRLARETGGRSFLIGSARELESIYDSIEEELRSQYLLAYQSTHEEGGPFRRVEVSVSEPGLKAKTIPGYFP